MGVLPVPPPKGVWLRAVDAVTVEVVTETIGFVGAGPIGTTLARLSIAAGLDVIMSNSRGPDTLADVVAELGPHARAGTVGEAADSSAIVVLAIPLNAHHRLDPEIFAGKVVVDTMNYYRDRDSAIPELEGNELTSSELVQRHLRDARIVKALNNLDYYRLGRNARPKGDRQRSTLPVAADDPAAKAQVVAFMDTIGYDATDVGALADGWRFGPGTPIYGLPYIAAPPERLNTPEEERSWFFDTPSATVTAERAKALLAQAVRGQAGHTPIPGYAYPPPAA